MKRLLVAVVFAIGACQAEMSNGQQDATVGYTGPIMVGYPGPMIGVGPKYPGLASGVTHEAEKAMSSDGAIEKVSPKVRTAIAKSNATALDKLHALRKSLTDLFKQVYENTQKLLDTAAKDQIERRSIAVRQLNVARKAALIIETDATNIASSTNSWLIKSGAQSLARSAHAIAQQIEAQLAKKATPIAPALVR